MKYKLEKKKKKYGTASFILQKKIRSTQFVGHLFVLVWNLCASNVIGFTKAQENKKEKLQILLSVWPKKWPICELNNSFNDEHHFLCQNTFYLKTSKQQPVTHIKLSCSLTSLEDRPWRLSCKTFDWKSYPFRATVFVYTENKK